MRWMTRLAPALLLALGLAAGSAVLTPAAAHGGEIDVELGTDGAGGISAALTWAGDGHPVEESAVVVVRAVSDDGEKVGPVTLDSASEGVGWYRSPGTLLDEGHWTVTAKVKKPDKVEVTTEVDVVAPPEAPEATAEDAESGKTEETKNSDADDAASEISESEASEAEGSGTEASGADATNANDRADAVGGLPTWIGWALAACAVLAVAAVVVVRRRKT